MNQHYLSDPNQVVLCKGAIEGLRMLVERGYQLVVVTNQSGIGRGYFAEADMRMVHERIEDLLGEETISIESFLFCPHLPDDNCKCRKPNPGLIEDWEKEHPINKEYSYVIGDRLCDIELGNNAKLKTALIKTTNYPEIELAAAISMADYLGGNLKEIAKMIP
ncbi:MAG: HAD family hydrolase [Opitutales bacterium]|nr:HAD family hydrolase [Opitutales bacterium]